MAAVCSEVPAAHPVEVRLLSGHVFSVGALPAGTLLSNVCELMRRLHGFPLGSLFYREKAVGVVDGPATVHAVLRLRAGKGGFGKDLKQKGKNSTHKTVNFDACKTLDGRTVRETRQLEALERWAAGEDDADEATLLSTGAVLSHSEVRKRKMRHAALLEQRQAAVARPDDWKRKRDEQEAEIAQRAEGMRSGHAAVLESTRQAVLQSLSSDAKKPKCPENHVLSAFAVGKTGFEFNVCDGCEEHIESGTVRRCTICDYDICDDCTADTFGPQAAPEPVPAPSSAKKAKPDPEKKPAEKKKSKSAFAHSLGSDDDDDDDDDTD